MVTSLTEQMLMERLTQETEAVLYRQLIGEMDMPVEANMSEYQVINLLRQVLRVKMGAERFEENAILGSRDGQKEVADMFESIVEAYLRRLNIRFQTETELRSVKAKGPKLTLAQAKKWKATATKDDQNRTLFTGACCLCGTICQCPFQPLSGRVGPQCRNCFINLTPDFLLLDDVFINGQKVSWIDCKCYYGSASMGVYGERSLQRVGQDYPEKFGPGAIIFAFGFCEALKVEGSAVLLDGTHLDMTSLDVLLASAPFRQLRRRNLAALVKNAEIV